MEIPNSASCEYGNSKVIKYSYFIALDPELNPII